MIARGMDEIMNDKAHVSSMPLLGRTTDAPLLWRDCRFRSFGKTLHIRSIIIPQRRIGRMAKNGAELHSD
jgi:hypothetical protein